MLVTPMIKRKRSTHGFTLIELMVVIAVAAILLTLAAPSFSSLIAAQRLRNASFDLVSDLLLARSEALKLQRTVVLTPSSTGADGWANGWSINVDSSSGTVITTRSGLPAAVRFVPTPSSLTSLSYGPDGRLSSGAAFTVRADAADAQSMTTWSCVRLDATGRPKAIKGGACS